MQVLSLARIRGSRIRVCKYFGRKRCRIISTRIRNTASDKINFSYGDPYQIRYNDYLNLCSGAGGAPVLHDPPERVHRLFYRREHPLAGRRLLQEWSRQVRNVVS